MTALGYRKRTFQIEKPDYKSLTETIQKADISNLEFYLNTYCLSLYICHCECLAFCKDKELAFSRKETMYFDYVKECLKLIDYTGELLSYQIRNILDCCNTKEQIDNVVDVLDKMFDLVRPTHTLYIQNNAEEIIKTYDIITEKDAIKISVLVRCFTISRLLHIAQEYGNRIYDKFYDKHPNVDLIVKRDDIDNLLNSVHNILLVLCTHLLNTNVIKLTPNMVNIHKNYVATLGNRQLFKTAYKELYG